MLGQETRTGRPRLPVEHLVATQNYLKQPHKFADRLEKDEVLEKIPLGMVSPIFADDSNIVAAWSCFTRELTWLRESDRAIIELACLLRVELWDTYQAKRLAILTGEKPPRLENATVNAFRQVLAIIGATPTTISKILIQTKEEAPKAKKGARYAAWGGNA